MAYHVFYNRPYLQAVRHSMGTQLIRGFGSERTQHLKAFFQLWLPLGCSSSVLCTAALHQRGGGGLLQAPASPCSQTSRGRCTEPQEVQVRPHSKNTTNKTTNHGSTQVMSSTCAPLGARCCFPAEPIELLRVLNITPALQDCAL